MNNRIISFIRIRNSKSMICKVSTNLASWRFVWHCTTLHPKNYFIWNGDKQTYVRTSSSSVIAHPISPATNSIADDNKKTKNKKNENIIERSLKLWQHRYYNNKQWSFENNSRNSSNHVIDTSLINWQQCNVSNYQH